MGLALFPSPPPARPVPHGLRVAVCVWTCVCVRKSKCEQTRPRQRHAEPRGVASTSLHMRRIRGRPGTPGVNPVPASASARLERGEDSLNRLGVKSLVEERGVSGVSPARGQRGAARLLCFPPLEFAPRLGR